MVAPCLGQTQRPGLRPPPPLPPELLPPPPLQPELLLLLLPPLLLPLTPVPHGFCSLRRPFPLLLLLLLLLQRASRPRLKLPFPLQELLLRLARRRAGEESSPPVSPPSQGHRHCPTQNRPHPDGVRRGEEGEGGSGNERNTWTLWGKLGGEGQTVTAVCTRREREGHEGSQNPPPKKK